MSYLRRQTRFNKTSRNLNHQSLKRQQGIVIVIALFIVALIATMSYAMMARLERDTRRTSLILRNTQAEFYAQGSIAWALDTIKTDWEKQKPDQLIDITPIKSPVMDVNGYRIVSVIYDFQARFNVNNLGNPESQADFARLIQAVDKEIKEDQAKKIILGIVDWISPVAQQNEFAQYYAELPQPYRAAHKPMLSISELRLVKGMTPPLFNALQPYITALPASVQINVQTASAPVLVALSPTVTPDVASALVQMRARSPITSMKIFSELDIVKNHKIPEGKVTVTSHYFLVETDVTIEKQHVVLYTLVERSVNDKKAMANILWQSKGIW